MPAQRIIMNASDLTAPVRAVPAIRISGLRRLTQLLPGLFLCALAAGVAVEAGKLEWMRAHGLSGLTIAIVLGMLLGNTLCANLPSIDDGIAFAKQHLLRAGIILYGVRLTFQDIGHVGMAGVAIDAVVLASTFALALVLGLRVFKLDRTTVFLIGAGSSICGAAAIMATEPVVRARAEQVAVAVATVVVFGSLAIFLYPALYQFCVQSQGLSITPQSFGIYTGSTVHEVAQVVAAGRSISDEAANTAVIAKMVRVMMLAPFLVILSMGIARGKTAVFSATRVAVPWFAFAFIGVVALHSWTRLPRPVLAVAIDADTLLLAMAMTALGLTTRVAAVRRAGVKPLALGALLAAWLVVGGAAINYVGLALLG